MLANFCIVERRWQSQADIYVYVSSIKVRNIVEWQICHQSGLFRATYQHPKWERTRIVISGNFLVALCLIADGRSWSRPQLVAAKPRSKGKWEIITPLFYAAFSASCARGEQPRSEVVLRQGLESFDSVPRGTVVLCWSPQSARR